MLEILFTEPQLLSVFRVALQIEMVYAPPAEDMDGYPFLSVDDMISIEEGQSMSTDDESHNVQNEQGTF